MDCQWCGGNEFDLKGVCLGCGARKSITEGELTEELYNQSWEQVTPGIMRGTDGVLRWVYAMSLWRNPTIFITTSKVILVTCAAMALMLFTIDLFIDGNFFKSLEFAVSVVLLTGTILFVLLLISYSLYALILGGKYLVLFEMDNNCVIHRQMQSQYRKARTLAALGMMIAASGRNMSAFAAGYNSATCSSSRSDFDCVSKIEIMGRRDVIYLKEMISYNQVYARPEDFSFVCEYILARLGSDVQVVHK